jgi:hypothetical protein
MAERVFCIDFGSAFTKVALRRDPTADSALLACSGADVDFWIPTVVLVDRRGAEPRLEFGAQAAGRATGGGIDVYTDFKKHLFTPVPPAAGKHALSPLDALFLSTEFESLAAKYSVLPPQIEALRVMVASARTLIAPTGERQVSLEAHRQANAAKVACHFFIWLPALSGGDVAQQPGCKLLREAMHRAGWPLHPELPFVSEPESNAVGILTKGGNLLNRSGTINFGEMFSKGPLVTVLKGDPHHPTYRALVIDVGAFTTDFASLFVDTEGRTVTPAMGAGFTVQQQSLPFGVTQLDSRVRDALSPEKKELLSNLSPREHATFQRQAYSEGKGYRAPGVGIIGGEADRDAMQACLIDFAKRVADEALKFCAALQPANIQELILTGGGSSIPAVREALIAAAQTGSTFAKTHGPDLKRTKTGPPVDKLDDQFTRGGSALGGASIYFEKCYYA